jgi:hypothetical protein
LNNATVPEPVITTPTHVSALSESAPHVSVLTKESSIDTQTEKDQRKARIMERGRESETPTEEPVKGIPFYEFMCMCIFMYIFTYVK